MRLSFSTAGLFPRDSLESLKLVEKSGFQYAELMPQCRRETKPDFAHEILRETKIRVGSIHFPLVFFPVFYNPYPGMIEEARELIDDLVKSASILQTEVIVIHPPYFTDDTTREIFHSAIIENIVYLCEKAKECGTKVALENSPKGGRDAEEMLDVIREVRHENLFPMIDTTEAVESGEDPVEMIKALDVIHMHVSDHKGEKKHIMPGKGSLNWSDIVSVLKEKDYRGLIVVEPSYRYLLEDPVGEMKKVLEFLSKLLGW